jgi:hypothetical protein
MSDDRAIKDVIQPKFVKLNLSELGPEAPDDKGSKGGSLRSGNGMDRLGIEAKSRS